MHHLEIRRARNILLGAHLHGTTSLSQSAHTRFARTQLPSFTILPHTNVFSYTQLYRYHAVSGSVAPVFATCLVGLAIIGAGSEDVLDVRAARAAASRRGRQLSLGGALEHGTSDTPAHGSAALFTAARCARVVGPVFGSGHHLISHDAASARRQHHGAGALAAGAAVAGGGDLVGGGTLQHGAGALLAAEPPPQATALHASVLGNRHVAVLLHLLAVYLAPWNRDLKILIYSGDDNFLPRHILMSRII